MRKPWIAQPAARTIDLDDPAATALHRQIIQRKPFLRRLYEEWYGSLAASLPDGEGGVLEIGSGPGFLHRYVPDAITSDLVPAEGVRVVLDATRLPFARGSMRAIVMTNVLHHVAKPRAFFEDAARVVRERGTLVMMEPWLSTWSRFVFGRLHHEPFDPEAHRWEFPPGGRLSTANGALPWIIFQRDRTTFEREFPQWRIDAIQPGTPFRYLLSGGLSYRSLVPSATFAWWRACEQALAPWPDRWAMFALIRLVRLGPPARFT